MQNLKTLVGAVNHMESIRELGWTGKEGETLQAVLSKKFN